MNLPPSVLSDRLLRIDFTRFSKVQECARKGWHTVALKRVPVPYDEALGFGKVIHAAQEWRFKRAGNKALPKSSQVEQEAVIEDAFSKLSLPEDEWRDCGRAKEAIALFNQLYGDEPYEILATEQGAEKELGTVEVKGVGKVKIMWQGRADNVVRYKGHVMPRDFKTTQFEIDPDKEHALWKMSGQMRGYCFLFSDREYGPLRGAMIDKLVVRKPLQKATSNAKPRTEWKRTSVVYTDQQIVEWRAHTLRSIESWLNLCAQEDPPPMNDGACTWPKKCPYFDVCSLADEKSRMAWLMSSAYRDDEFDPLAV